MVYREFELRNATFKTNDSNPTLSHAEIKDKPQLVLYASRASSREEI
jgi:hypothetical protein